MRGMKNRICILWLAMGGLVASYVHAGESEGSHGWQATGPRQEILPRMEIMGSDEDPLLVVSTGQESGRHGQWLRRFPVQGGKYYSFEASYWFDGVEHPRRSIVVRLDWENDKGGKVASQESVNPDYFPGRGLPPAQAEFPAAHPDVEGWWKASGTYRAPEDAARVVVRLEVKWAPRSEVVFRGIRWTPGEAPAPRLVRLATVHFQPRGGRTPEGNRELFVPLVEEAALQKADLIVLPESLTLYGTGRKYHEVAEPVPGPSTRFFGALSRKHDLYIVAGILEQEGDLVYNTAILTGPDGKLVGRYRKVTLPMEEIAGGICPGDSYPVFDTRFGKLGMMICYDVFFPEVGRELARAGAEVVALPIWGGNPKLAEARAVENHFYLVTSTYTSHEDRWMRSGIYDREGQLIADADHWGQVVVREVDLAQRTYWTGLGDFRARIFRESPVQRGESGHR